MDRTHVQDSAGIDLPASLQSALLNALVSDSSVGICVLDSQIRYVYVNAKLAEMNGIPREAHLGVAIDSLLPGFLDPIRHLVEEVVHHRQWIPDLILEGETPQAPGVKRAWRESWYPVSIDQGEYTAVLVREITDERTLFSKLAEANRRKGALMATVAHELRNPLGPLVHIASLLKTFSDPKAHQLSDMVSRQVGQLTRIVEDLLDASYIRQGLFRIERRLVRLREIIEEALFSVRDVMVDKQQVLTLNWADFDQVFQADHARLVQVFSNILSNAVKYTATGGSIKIQSRLIAGNVIVDVIDNGRGIPEDQLDKVFEQFSRGPHETPDIIEGLGIGLWLARALVESHGGTLTALRNFSEQGTTFRMNLPSVG